MPKVSVIIPVYGVEKYIERCARSLFEQTLDDIEYLFIDDCTPDKSIEVLKSVLEEYPNRKDQVIIHRMEQNSGQAAVRKWGMQHVTGEYVIHCDSDDWVDCEMYHLMYEKALEDDADIVLCDFFQSDGVTHKSFRDNIKEGQSLFQSLITKHTHSVVWNKLVRKNLYGPDFIYPKNNMGEDFVITIQFSVKCKKVSKINTPLYYYYFNPSSLTKSSGYENVMSRFLQAKINTDLVCNFVHSIDEEAYDQELMCLQINTKLILLSCIEDSRAFKLWKDNYNLQLSKLLLNKQLSVRDKIRYVVINLGLYKKNILKCLSIFL